MGAAVTALHPDAGAEHEPREVVDLAGVLGRGIESLDAIRDLALWHVATIGPPAGAADVGASSERRR